MLPPSSAQQRLLDLIKKHPEMLGRRKPREPLSKFASSEDDRIVEEEQAVRVVVARVMASGGTAVGEDIRLRPTREPLSRTSVSPDIAQRFTIARHAENGSYQGKYWKRFWPQGRTPGPDLG